jgi:hypothetical protein
MSATIYWTVLVIGTVLLSYLSSFQLAPLVFLGGGAILGVGYLVLSARQRARNPQWNSGGYRTRFAGSIILYVALFWVTAQLGKSREPMEFWASYEPYVENGKPRGYVFRYLDFKDSYERIDSPELNSYLREKAPERVKLVLEVVKDFGRLRSYSVQRVETFTVNSEWIDGMPPWAALRQR